MATNKASQVITGVARQTICAVIPAKAGIFLALGTLILAACGGETTENVTNISQMGMDVVSSVGDLPKCTGDNEGEQAFVKGETSARICVDGKWLSLSAGDNATIECSTKPLADKSGLKIICNGDSIGVVLNGANGKDGADGRDGAKGDKGDAGDPGAAGKDGLDGKDGENGKDGEPGTAGKDGLDGKDGDDGVGCSIASQTDSTVTVKCGSGSFTMNLNGGSAASIIDTGDVTYEIENASISGVSQKGPFVKGASVTAFELDGSKSLLQTGRTFVGTISQDDGRFNMSNVTLKSSYVRLSANGYYRNEVTGESSTSPITLNAVTDLDARSTVNVNLLTHLEYDRVAHLMAAGDGTQKIKTLKKQAEMEIFKAFHIDATGFGYSEDLDVFGSSEADAALLAISILLQGDRSESQLTELLAELSDDLSDGTWDNAAKRAEIADSALSKDAQRLLATYRNNVRDWGLSTTVPHFEKYIRRFASIENGLGVCGSDSTPVGTVKQVTNKKSKTYYAASYTDATNKTRFICADADSAKWRVATDVEKDTMGWGAGAFDGEVQVGQINTSIYYIYETSKKSWRYATTLEKDTYQKTCSEDGTLFSGNVTDTVYVCDDGKFRMANSTEISYGKGCTSHNSGELYIPHKQYSYYKCSAKGWEYDFENLNVGTLTYGGKTYKTIGIKTQNWMAENLNYEVEGQSFCYKNEPDSCAKYGRLYTWAAAVGKTEEECVYGKTCGLTGTVRGICPEGWHLPSSSEWNTLYSAMGSSPYAMQAKGVANWPDATDAYGFSVLPVGYYENGYFPYVGERAYFWSATEVNIYYANNWNLGADFASLSGGLHKIYGFSIRCVMD